MNCNLSLPSSYSLFDSQQYEDTCSRFRSSDGGSGPGAATAFSTNRYPFGGDDHLFYGCDYVELLVFDALRLNHLQVEEEDDSIFN